MCQEPCVCALEMFSTPDNAPVQGLPSGFSPAQSIGGICPPAPPPQHARWLPGSPAIPHGEIQLSEAGKPAKNKPNKLASAFRAHRCSLIWHFNLRVKLSRVFAQRVAKF